MQGARVVKAAMQVQKVRFVWVECECVEYSTVLVRVLSPFFHQSDSKQAVGFSELRRMLDERIQIRPV